MSECKRCGKCCENNGLIPPALASEKDTSPPWLWVAVVNLRRLFGGVAENYRCVFFDTETGLCSIHEHKPEICREFHCDD